MVRCARSRQLDIHIDVRHTQCTVNMTPLEEMIPPLLQQLQRDVFSAPKDASGNSDAQIEGWMPTEFISGFERALLHVHCDVHGKVPVTVIEVGSWKGLSANRMAKICKQRGVSAEIVCIDTWLGSPEHMEGESASHGMRRVNGVPTLLTEFAKNTKTAGNDDSIFPFPISSAQGASYLASKGVMADIIYVDAGHEYESVLLDLRLYWSLLRPGGVMIMDDYRWPGVRKAIDEHFAGVAVVRVGHMQALAFKDGIPSG